MKLPVNNQQYKHISGKIVTVCCATEKNGSKAIVFECDSGNIHSMTFYEFKTFYNLIK